MSAHENALNAVEVAQILNIGRNAVYDLAKSGKLRSYRMGRKLLFTLDDVNAYFAAQCGKPALQVGPRAGNAGALANPQASSDSPLVEALGSLASAEKPFLIAGDTPIAATLAGFLQAEGVAAALAPCPDYAALVKLYAREADAAVVSLYDAPTNSCNTAYARRLMPGVPTISFRLGAERAGFVVRAGNPKKITTWGGLFRSENLLVNQPRGTAARILLDQKATSMEYLPHSINGYWNEAPSAHDAICLVEDGLADACIGTEGQCANHARVLLIPMQTLTYDLVIARSKRTAPLIKALKRTLSGKPAHAAFRTHGTLNLDNLGAIVFEC